MQISAEDSHCDRKTPSFPGLSATPSKINRPLDLHSVFGGSWVGCDCDVVPELAKGSCQHPGALLLSLGIRFGALLDKSNPFVQDLPNHAAESMGDCPDGGLIAEPR